MIRRLMLIPLVCLFGCDALPYLLHVAEGQLRVTGRVEPIDEVLASGRLTDEQQSKLELIVAAREFARERIGLSVGGSYSTFYDTGGDPLAFNLSAAYRDRLQPLTIEFPVIGRVPYVAFFDEDYLLEWADRLEREGFDVFTYEVDAYSTLGFFDDPVRSPMLRRGEISLADTIIHELLHNTIYRPGDTDFNESMATFVGRSGAIEFLAEYYGQDSGYPELARRLNEDADRVNAFLVTLGDDLRHYFNTPATIDERIAGREAVYQAGRERFTSDVLPLLHFPERYAGYANLPTNNAWMLLNFRYNTDLTLFEAVFERLDHDWRATLDVFREAARASCDPFAWLSVWIGEDGRGACP